MLLIIGFSRKNFFFFLHFVLNFEPQGLIYHNTYSLHLYKIEYPSLKDNSFQIQCISIVGSLEYYFLHFLHCSICKIWDTQTTNLIHPGAFSCVKLESTYLNYLQLHFHSWFLRKKIYLNFPSCRQC